MKLDNFHEYVIENYGLHDKATHGGFVYVAVKRGMYGLPQAGILAQELLEERLNKHGYRQSKFTPNSWTHDYMPRRRREKARLATELAKVVAAPAA